MLAALLAVGWSAVAPQSAAAQASYAQLSVLTAQLCDEEQPKAGACPVAADLPQVAALCRLRATAVELAAALGTTCVTSKLAAIVPAGGAAPAGGARLPFFTPSLVADFFAARLKAELAHFVKRRAASLLCGEKEEDKRLARQLMPETCALLASAGDLGLTGIPDALKADLRGLPSQLPGAALALVTAGSPEHTALCTLDAAARTYPRLQQSGAVAALKFLATLTPHTQCAGVAQLHSVQSSAAVLAELIEQINAHVSRGSALDPRAVVAAAKLIVDNLPGLSTAEKAALQARIGAAADPLTRGLEVLLQLASSGQKNGEQLAGAFDALAELVTALSSNTPSKDLAALLRAIGAFTGGRYSTALLQLRSVSALDQWMSKGRLALFWKAVAKLGPLLAGLAEAQSDEEARQVIEAAAEPLGSYRAFREEGWAFFVSGYAGLGGGIESGDEIDDSGMFTPLLPVGLEMGWRIGDSSFTFNALVSVIDVGALAAVRFSDNGHEGVAENGELKGSASEDFAGVIAPGLFVSLGLGDSPFLVGLGAQYLPASRSVFDCPTDVLCSDTRAEPVVRGMLFLGIDLPILSISQ